VLTHLSTAFVIVQVGCDIITAGGQQARDVRARAYLVPTHLTWAAARCVRTCSEKRCAEEKQELGNKAEII